MEILQNDPFVFHHKNNSTSLEQHSVIIYLHVDLNLYELLSSVEQQKEDILRNESVICLGLICFVLSTLQQSVVTKTFWLQPSVKYLLLCSAEESYVLFCIRFNWIVHVVVNGSQYFLVNNILQNIFCKNIWQHLLFCVLFCDWIVLSQPILPTLHILKLVQDRFGVAFWRSMYPFSVTIRRKGSSVVLNRKPLASICWCDTGNFIVIIEWYIG